MGHLPAFCLAPFTWSRPYIWVDATYGGLLVSGRGLSFKRAALSHSRQLKDPRVTLSEQQRDGSAAFEVPFCSLSPVKGMICGLSRGLESPGMAARGCRLCKAAGGVASALLKSDISVPPGSGGQGRAPEPEDIRSPLHRHSAAHRGTFDAKQHG